MVLRANRYGRNAAWWKTADFLGRSSPSFLPSVLAEDQEKPYWSLLADASGWNACRQSCVDYVPRLAVAETLVAVGSPVPDVIGQIGTKECVELILIRATFGRMDLPQETQRPEKAVSQKCLLQGHIRKNGPLDNALYTTHFPR
jgi:hypothetical protein